MDPSGVLAQYVGHQFNPTGGPGGSGQLAVLGQVQAASVGRTGSLCGSTAAVEAGDGTNVARLCDGTDALRVTNGALHFPGSTGNSLQWDNSTAPPTPQAVLSVPLSAYGGGVLSHFLGDPDVWLLVQQGANILKIPAYTA